MAKYRIKEYEALVAEYERRQSGGIGIYKGDRIEKRYEVERYSSWWIGWQTISRVYKNEEDARSRIKSLIFEEEVRSGKRVRYINNVD
jgi:hypothetical protein